MRFIHISDLHFNPISDGRTSRDIRNGLITYLKKESITADELLVTGDYRHAKFQVDPPQADIEAVVAFIKGIAAAVNIKSPDHIHLVPGNHDRKRNYRDNRKLAVIRKTYDASNGCFDENDLVTLLQYFGYFRRICNSLYGTKNVWEERTLHTYRVSGKTVFLYLNTAIMHNCDEDRKQRRLIIGNDLIDRLLNEIDVKYPTFPIIVLAHHSPDYFEKHEKAAIEEILLDHPRVILYLCGDSNKAWPRRVNNHIEIATGCLKHTQNIETTFLYGDTASQEFSVYHWVGAWEPYAALNEQLKKLLPVESKSSSWDDSDADKTEKALLSAYSSEQLYKERFGFHSKLYPTVGRATELQRLLDFIMDSSGFRWWAITGPGGSGKSRLALRLSESLPHDWKTVWLSRSTYQHLESLTFPSENVLFIVDYVQGFAEEIGDWILNLSTPQHSHKVRILLIERDSGDWEDRVRDCFRGNWTAEAAEYNSEDGFLRLSPIEKKDLLALMAYFATSLIQIRRVHKKKGPSRNERKHLLAALNRVDPGLLRPLYALFLTDAWLTGADPIRWSKANLLDSVLSREERLIRSRARKIMTGNADMLFESSLLIWRAATVLQPSPSEDISTLFPATWTYLESKAQEKDFVSATDLLSRLGLCHSDIIPPMTPDLLGERFVLNWLLSTSNNNRASFLASVWTFRSTTFVFFERVLSDYSDLLDENESKWDFLIPEFFVHGEDDSLYASFLLLITAKTNNSYVANKTVRELKRLVSIHPGEKEFAELLAAGQANTVSSFDKKGAEEVVNQIRDLLVEWPQNIEIAKSYASGLANLSAIQDANDAYATTNILETLSDQWPEDRNLAFTYARGLVNLTSSQDASDAAASIVQLEDLEEKWASEHDFAVELANGLINLASVQDYYDASLTVEKIFRLSITWPRSTEIAVALSTALFNLALDQDTSTATRIVGDLQKLSTKWPDNFDISLICAQALANLCINQEEKEAQLTVSQIEQLLRHWPDEHEIAIELAKGLVNLSEKQNELSANKTVKRVIEISNLWPEDDYDFSLLTAMAYYNLSNVQSIRNSISSLGNLEKIARKWNNHVEIQQWYIAGVFNKALQDIASQCCFTQMFLDHILQQFPNLDSVAKCANALQDAMLACKQGDIQTAHQKVADFAKVRESLPFSESILS